MKIKPKSKKGQKGFSLIELLIVVAIILIIAAIAIPKYLSAKAAGQESAGASVTRSIATAAFSYDQRWNTFPTTAAAMGGTCNTTTPATSTLSCNLDDFVAKQINTKPIGAYNFTYTQVNGGSGFTLLADPASGVSATRHFYIDENLTPHVNETAAAGPTDPTL